jgi:hypothetical protein
MPWLRAETIMRASWFATGAGIALVCGAIAGCDTNYYGAGETRSTTTTTTAPPASASTTTVTPNPDGSVTSTERTVRRY